MSKILKVNKPSDYSSWVGQTDTNELISVIDHSAISTVRHSHNRINQMKIRHSTPNDLDRIMPVYESAKKYMRSEGNLTQWTGGYPSKDVILTDIAQKNHYIAEDENGDVLMVFTFIIGDDPTYDYIEGGQWLNNNLYGTVHRIASTGVCGGMMGECVKFCFGQVDNVRVDTHADNISMQRALLNLEFTRCGIIYIADGSPRVAFQKITVKN